MRNISALAIHPLGLQHADAIQRLAADPELAATTRIPHPYPENAAAEFIKVRLAEREQGQSVAFVITDGGELVGACGLNGIRASVAEELGYWVGRPYWGRGYATFGVQRVLAYAFEDVGLELVGSAALESNAASRRVLEKNGFRQIGLGPHNDPLLKRPHELLARYEITRPEWLAARR